MAVIFLPETDVNVRLLERMHASRFGNENRSFEGCSKKGWTCQGTFWKNLESSLLNTSTFFSHAGCIVPWAQNAPAIVRLFLHSHAGCKKLIFNICQFLCLTHYYRIANDMVKSSEFLKWYWEQMAALSSSAMVLQTVVYLHISKQIPPPPPSIDFSVSRSAAQSIQIVYSVHWIACRPERKLFLLAENSDSHENFIQLLALLKLKTKPQTVVFAPV